mgnify:CR=1 FL=1
MTYPTFTNGQVLPASDLNAIGLWLVKSQTVGTGVSSVTVSSAFSADYDAYKVVYVGGVGSTALNINMTLGASAANYSMALPYVTYGAGVASGTSIAGGTSWALMGTATANSASLDVDLFAPFLSQYTRALGIYVSDTEAGTYAGIHKTAASYTAFTLTASTGTLTGGTISVYGYRK